MAVLLPAADNKLWMLDLNRDILSRLTYGPGNDFSPTWSPDGRWVYFNSRRPNEEPSIFRIPSEGGEEALIVPPELMDAGVIDLYIPTAPSFFSGAPTQA